MQDDMNAGIAHMTDEARKEAMADKLREPIEESVDLSERLGLEPYPVDWHITDYDEMNEYASYGGYPERYPHWRWGMIYDIQKKQGRYAGGRIYELVINNDPAHAYLQESNRVANQKLTITHVQAHSDFFANNKAFQRYADEARSVDILAQHAREIDEMIRDPEVDADRDEIERWIDNLLTIEDNINQHVIYKDSPYRDRYDEDDEEEDEESQIRKEIDALDIPDRMKERFFEEDWIEEMEELEDDENEDALPPWPEADLHYFLREHGRAYDREKGRSVEYEDWQKRVIDIMRDEAYFFAPQKMTKVMNEGWAAYWHALMMEEEQFATENEIIDYAAANAGVLSGSATNPYTLGKNLFQHVENITNRKEVASKLLQVDGVTPDNFDTLKFYPWQGVDADHAPEEYLLTFDAWEEEQDPVSVLELLQPDEALAWIREESLEQLEASVDPEQLDQENLEKAKNGEIDLKRHPWKILTYDGLAERHFSLSKPQNWGFLEDIPYSELEELYRYIDESDRARYDTVEAAMDDVDYAAGWNKMYEVRDDHVDMTFIDEFLNQEFVDKKGLFTYEYLPAGDYAFPITTDTGKEAVRKKLVFKHTNFGKPIIKVHDGNWEDMNQLLLGHHYNGVELHQPKALKTLERIQEMWGRPVHLNTIEKIRDDQYMWDAEAAVYEMYRALQEGREAEIQWPEAEEVPVRLTYDPLQGFHRTEIEWDEVEEMGLTADKMDANTVPEEWRL